MLQTVIHYTELHSQKTCVCIRKASHNERILSQGTTPRQCMPLPRAPRTNGCAKTMTGRRRTCARAITCMEPRETSGARIRSSSSAHSCSYWLSESSIPPKSSVRVTARRYERSAEKSEHSVLWPTITRQRKLFFVHGGRLERRECMHLLHLGVLVASRRACCI